MPNFTTKDVINAINTAKAATTGTNLVEVFTEYPADQTMISEGIYVSRVYQADRVKSTNGVSPGGHIYLIKDRVEMFIVTQQVNTFVNNLLNLMSVLIDNALFQEYHLREHTIDQVYVNNSERYKVIFDLTKMQVI
jgi:hypothetical protein